MLKREQLSTPSDKLKLFEKFQPQKQTWLVSDHKSKLEIQNRLLQKHPAVETDAVFRASELWRRLLWLHYPEIRPVSMDLVRSLIQRELNARKVVWAKGAGAAHSLTQLMPQFLPLFGQVEDLDLVRQWLQANTESLLKWGHWFELAAQIWDVLEGEQMLPSAWAPAYLLAQNAELKWHKDLIVDLSAQLSPTEEILLTRLNRQSAVTLLEPKPSWEGAGADLQNLKIKGAFRAARFSSPLAEVKDAVAQARIWLESGAPAPSIAIVAPDIESYWPILAPTLRQEGISADKARTIPLHSLPSVQTWLARLRLKSGRLDPADLEIAAFDEGQARPKMTFERFKKFFSHLYSENQLHQENWLSEKFAKEFDVAQVLTRDEFVILAAGLWCDRDLKPLERLLKDLLEDCPSGTRLDMGLWLDWLESKASKIELQVEAPENGMHITDIMAAEWLDLKHIYMLGLSEENLRTFNAQGLSALEAEKIFQDLGVFVPSNEQATLEFEARWLLEKPELSGVLSCAVTDPIGNPLTPSRLWLLQNENPRQALKNLSTPLACRWDELQNAQPQSIAELRDWPLDHMQDMLDGLSQDLGLKPLPPFAANSLKRFSPSALEKYSQCPFKYAAERLFLLSDSPVADLDLDPLTRGSLIHKVFETLTEEPRRFDWSEGEISLILDAARAEADWLDQGLWTQLRQRLVEVAYRFLKAEKEWLETYPDTRTVARELPFEAAWSRKKKKVIHAAQVEPGDLLFTGRIDRVDSSKPLGDFPGREYVVIDYKSSDSGTHSAVNWPKNDSFQLALYSEVVEGGLTELPAAPVRGAFYYSAKDFERQKGIHIEGESPLLPMKGRRNSGVSEEKKFEIITELHERIEQLLLRAEQGDFAPQPKNQDDCPKCQWRNLCRAPHLN